MYRILVADDEADERALIRYLLRDFDTKFELYEAKNGREALSIIRQKEIDILISDIQMGFMTGIELAAEVRKTHPDLEILFFSGYDDFEYVKDALSLRAVNYILKPVDPKELRRSLLEILERLGGRDLQFVQSLQSIEKQFFAASKNGAAGKNVRNPSGSAVPPLSDSALAQQEYSEEDSRLLKDIASAISMKNPDMLREQVQTLLDKYSGSNLHTHIYVRYICTSLLEQLMSRLSCQPREFEEAAGKIFMLRHFSDIESLILQYTEKMIDQINQETGASNYVVYLVQQYIDLHYGEDLNLNQLADQVFLSPNYLSNVFTKHTGCSLNKYIKQVRLAKACELLANTNMKIADVGREVGYPNTSYFIKKFQEVYNKTPEKYRLQPYGGQTEEPT